MIALVPTWLDLQHVAIWLGAVVAVVLVIGAVSVVAQALVGLAFDDEAGQ